MTDCKKTEDEKVLCIKLNKVELMTLSPIEKIELKQKIQSAIDKVKREIG